MSITVAQATKSFSGAKALDGVSLTVEPGQFFAILGPSGCGKTTLLRLIAGLETLDAGEIRLGGRLVADARTHIAPEDRGAAVVFQSYALWPHLSVAANVAFPQRAARAPAAQAEAVTAEALAAVAMADYAERKPAALSGGQRQRVALARCLAQQADVVLMDEPLANLDPHLRGAMEQEFAAFRARSGASILYITHDQREAMALADRAAVMDRGRILQIGAPEALYARPASEAVARFIGQSAIVDAAVQSCNETEALSRIGPFTVTAGHGGDATDGPMRAMIRPEDVRVGDGAVMARISAAYYRGGAWDVTLEAPGLSAPLHTSIRRRPTIGEMTPVALTLAWLLPA